MGENTSFTQNIDTLFSDIQDFVKTDSVIGDPVCVGDRTFVPLMNVTLGYGSTAMGKMPNSDNSMSGGLGLGARISTSAVMVIEKDGVTMLPVSEKSNMGQIMDKIPQAIANMGQNMMGQGKNQGQNMMGQGQSQGQGQGQNQQQSGSQNNK